MRLTGVVTDVIAEWTGFTFQDGTDGIYVAWGRAGQLQPGQQVEVDGAAMAGNFAPGVEAGDVRVLGEAPLPAAAKITPQQFATGACDNRYVEVEGIVRSARRTGPPAWGWPALALRIDFGGDLVTAYVRGAPDPPARLVDATVRARGVCLIFSNSRRQFMGDVLSVGRPEDLAVDRPGPVDLFDAPLRPLDRLFGYAAGGSSTRRTRAAGVATLQIPGGVYIQDGEDGILVRATPADQIWPGDRVEAVGYPAAGDFSAVLDDALIRVTGHGADPAPVDFQAGQVLRRIAGAPAAPDGMLVRIAGTVLEWAPSTVDETLRLEDGETTFSVRLPGAAKQQTLALLAPGSRVAVTGVCVVQARGAEGPRRFELLPRSAADIVRVARAPISRATALRVAVVLLGILLAAAIWLVLLKRRVARQTAIIRAQFQREASIEQRYADLVENASDPMYVRDIHGALLQVNRGAVALTGYTREELLAMNVMDLVVPEDRGRVRKALAGREELPAGASDWRIRTKQGKDLVVEIKQRLLHENGRPVRVECIGRDVTAQREAHSAAVSEQRRLEAQLQQSQKMESIGLLAGGVAHDFNNLLTVIAGYAQMAQHDLPEGHPAREAIDEIAQAAERASGLTRQLLMFSRRQMSSPKTLSINELVANLEKMLRRLISEDIELTLRLQAAADNVRADAGHLEQVIVNLAVNARDAMPNGGRLTIETNDTAAGEADGVAPGRCVELMVSDTGVGMTPEVRERIFEPFFTTKEKGKGTGLGLSTVYGIVKQSGGAISVSSEPGRGSKFRILLPCVALPSVASPRGAPQMRTSAGSETILLAEDEDGVRKFVCTVLRSQGYTVLEAGNGREALDVAHGHAGPIHLLLTDVVMPGMGGVELAERFSVARPEAAVLMMSGYSDRALPPERSAKLLAKPFTSSTLLARVREMLEERTQSA